MQRDLQMGACARNCKLCPLFCFSIFCIFLQYAATCSSCSVGHEIYVYIYICIILSWLIQLHSGLIAAIHLETKKACSFLASCMWCALMLQDVIPLISQNILIKTKAWYHKMLPSCLKLSFKDLLGMTNKIKIKSPFCCLHRMPLNFLKMITWKTHQMQFKFIYLFSNFRFTSCVVNFFWTKTFYTKRKKTHFSNFFFLDSQNSENFAIKRSW